MVVNLSKGKSKSASLRQAKLDYLENSSLSEKSPYYWSAFVLMGNDSAVSTTDNNILYIIAGVVLLVLVVLFFVMRRRNSVV